MDICVRYVVHVHVADVYFEKLKGRRDLRFVRENICFFFSGDTSYE